MEAFYKEISDKLEQKSIEFGLHIEPKHKEIISKSYECMRDCYKRPGSIEESSRCAENCQNKVQSVHNELQAVIENIQGYFQNCIQACRLGHSKKEDESKVCINECTSTAIGKFNDSQSIAERIVNKYAN